MKSIGVKRVWYLMTADVEMFVDDAGRTTDQPIAEPEVLGLTVSVETAERALGTLVEDRVHSVVRSTVRALPKTVQDVLQGPTEAEKILALLDLEKK